MKKLLIVDDDVPLLDSLRFVFRGLYEVQTATSAEEAAPLLERNPPDVLLLDIHLPGIDGLEYLRRLRQRHAHLPVVMISAASTLRPLLKALDLGDIDYIRKPFDIEELRLVVARALRQGDLRQRIEQLEQELAGAPGTGKRHTLKQTLENYERRLIQQALQRAGGIQTRAAQMLGTTRRILRYRMDKLAIPGNDS